MPWEPILICFCASKCIHMKFGFCLLRFNMNITRNGIGIQTHFVQTAIRVSAGSEIYYSITLLRAAVLIAMILFRIQSLVHSLSLFQSAPFRNQSNTWSEYIVNAADFHFTVRRRRRRRWQWRRVRDSHFPVIIPMASSSIPQNIKSTFPQKSESKIIYWIIQIKSGKCLRFRWMRTGQIATVKKWNIHTTQTGAAQPFTVFAFQHMTYNLWEGV